MSVVAFGVLALGSKRGSELCRAVHHVDELH